jgi:ribosomal protein L21E
MDAYLKWIQENLQILLDKKAKKLGATLIEGEITTYWAGNVLRIDIKPSDRKE